MRNPAQPDTVVSVNTQSQDEWLPDLAHALQVLEKRYVFDAALVSDLVSASDIACGDGGCEAPAPSLGDALSAAAAALDAPVGGATSSSAVYVIDGNIDQRDTIIAGLPTGATVIMIDSARDGVTQLAAALEGMSGVSELHIFAHGEAGSLSLGASVLDQASMNTLYRATLAGLGTHLGADADILIYGCNFAEGSEGQAATDLLAALTGADVAASTDLTGAARLGGDWTLEYESGSLEATALAFEAYDATLAPPVAVSETYSTGYNTAVSGDVSPNDSDPESDPLTFSVYAQPANGSVSLNSDGTFTYTPNNGFSGEDFFIYRVTDNTSSNPNFANASVTIVVAAAPNAPPVANDDSYTTLTDVQVSGNVCTNDTDADGDTLTHTLTTGPTNGTLTLNTDGTFTYTPNAGYTGTDSFVYTTSDGNGGTDTATATITISAPPPNAPPVANDDSYSTAQNTAVSGDVCTNDTDADGDTLTHTLTTGPTNGTLTLNTDGTFTYTPNSGYSGTDTFTYTSSDGNGGTDTATVTITVSAPSNQAPDAVNDSATTNEDTALTGTVATNDSDPDSDPLTYAVQTSPSHGSVTLNANGTFTYTPTSGYSGTDSFTYSVSDGHGGTDSAVVTVTVVALNDAPVFTVALGPQADQDGEVVSLNIGAQVTDVDSPQLVYAATGLPPGLSLNPLTGVISGTIDKMASEVGPTGNGTYPVEITVVDLAGGITTQTFVWTVTNPAPDAVNDTIATNAGVTATGTVATNDRDPDGDAVTYTLGTGPAHGTLTLNANGSYTYVPNAGFNGADSFTYRLTDSQGASDTATVTITVNPVNGAPVVTGTISSQTGTDNTTATLDVSDCFADPNNDPLTFTATGLPAGLTVNAATGVISGTIAQNACAGGPLGNGVYTVTVTATDPSGLAVSHNFSWTVTNPKPDAVNDSFTGLSGQVVTGTVTTNDSDPDGDSLSYTLVSGPTAGSIVLNTNGTFSYTGNPLYSGNDSFVYRVTDANGASDTATVSVTLAPTEVVPPALSCIITFGDLSYLRSILGA